MSVVRGNGFVGIMGACDDDDDVGGKRGAYTYPIRRAPAAAGTNDKQGGQYICTAVGHGDGDGQGRLSSGGSSVGGAIRDGTPGSEHLHGWRDLENQVRRVLGAGNAPNGIYRIASPSGDAQCVPDS